MPDIELYESELNRMRTNFREREAKAKKRELEHAQADASAAHAFITDAVSHLFQPYSSSHEYEWLPNGRVVFVGITFGTFPTEPDIVGAFYNCPKCGAEHLFPTPEKEELGEFAERKARGDLPCTSTTETQSVDTRLLAVLRDYTRQITHLGG